MKNRTKEYNKTQLLAEYYGQPLDHVKPSRKSNWMKGFFVSPRRSEMDLVTGERIGRVQAWKSRLIKSGHTLALILMILPSLGHSASFTKAGWEVGLRPGTTCTASQFWADVYSNGFRLVENRTDPAVPSKPIAVIRWGTVQQTVYQFEYLQEIYHARKVPFNKAQYAALWKQFKIYKDYIQVNTRCLKSWGPANDRAYISLNSFDTYTAGQAMGLPAQGVEFAPGKVPTRAYVIDSAVASGAIAPDHWARYTAGQSYWAPTPTSIGPYAKVTHGAEMAFMLAMSSNAAITQIAIHGDGDLDPARILAGVKAAARMAIDHPEERAVISKSFASLGGLFEKEVRLVEAAAKAGIVTVQAIGNDGHELLPTAPVVPELITVGYVVTVTDGLMLKSNYTKTGGPNLVCDETGYAPMIQMSGSQNPVIVKEAFSSYMSSGCTAMIAGTVTRMYGACPTAKPMQIKEALMSTATVKKAWYPDIPGQLDVRIVNPTAAIKKIVETSCTTVTLPDFSKSTWSQYDWNVYTWAIAPWVNNLVAEKRRQIIAKACAAKGGKATTIPTDPYQYQCLNSGQIVFLGTWHTVVNEVPYFALDDKGTGAL